METMTEINELVKENRQLKKEVFKLKAQVAGLKQLRAHAEQKHLVSIMKDRVSEEGAVGVLLAASDLALCLVELRVLAGDKLANSFSEATSKYIDTCVECIDAYRRSQG